MNHMNRFPLLSSCSVSASLQSCGFGPHLHDGGHLGFYTHKAATSGPQSHGCWGFPAISNECQMLASSRWV